MKKLLLSATLIITTASFAQSAFWVENFGQGCNRGTAANGFSTINGSWSEASTGTNDAYADGWFVSATASGAGAQNCSDNCTTNSTVTDRSLHVGNAAVAAANIGSDSGSTYITGSLCGFGICATTNKRIESPSINTVNRDSVGISFAYYEGGEFMGDEATLWYSPDNGVTWQMIDQLAKISASCAAPSGLWTEFSMLLPASASNNPGIKIAFEWVNDNDGVGSDPSFAVDDVTLLEDFPTAIAPVNTSSISMVTNENSVSVNAATNNWKVLSVVDVTGREIQVSTSGNEILFDTPAGMYFIRMEMNGEESVHKVLFTR